jgi:hypothetical protein
MESSIDVHILLDVSPTDVRSDIVDQYAEFALPDMVVLLPVAEDVIRMRGSLQQASCFLC